MWCSWGLLRAVERLGKSVSALGKKKQQMDTPWETTLILFIIQWTQSEEEDIIFYENDSFVKIFRASSAVSFHQVFFLLNAHNSPVSLENAKIGLLLSSRAKQLFFSVIFLLPQTKQVEKSC